MPVSQTPRWSRRKDARPDEILDAALDVFLVHGFGGARLDEVARLAGVSKGTLYLYFDSKSDLFIKVVNRGIVQAVLPDVRSIPDGDMAPLLRSCIRAISQVMGETRMGAMPKLLLAEAGRFPELIASYRRDVVEPIRGFIAGLINAGASRGEFRAVNADDAAFAMIAPLILLGVSRHIEPMKTLVRETPEAFGETLIDLYLAGLMAPAQKGQTT